MKNPYEKVYYERQDFDIFKSNVCHHLKDVGDIQFIIDVLECDFIGVFYSKHWNREALYMLAMVDYVSRLNDIPLCNKYDDLRCLKLKERIYPSGVYCIFLLTGDHKILDESFENAIPEFKNFNIVENEVRGIA